MGGALDPKAEAEASRKEVEAAHIDTDVMHVEDVDGVRETLHYDDSEDRFYVKRVEDVEPVLEWAKGRYNEGLVNQHCEFRLVGSYPRTVVSIFGRKWGIPENEIERMLGRDKDLTRKLLSDPDLSGFRTLAGKY